MLVALTSTLAITATTTLGAAHAQGEIVATGTEAGGDMPPAIEDFTYPNAQKIEVETGAILKRGDGHLLLATCDGNEDIRILSRTTPALDYCFDVTAKPAYLELKIPVFYGIIPGGDPVKVTVQHKSGTTQTAMVEANSGLNGFGESGNPKTDDVTLVELRIGS
ncbi:hypothetical protein ABZ135_23090 [Streptomyces sp. NPDC006339]|uniref:hypothetical protein n=1 Tax=Streptomyces sp. NPDC006339 TaxID=3156755 RepID=UPI0033A37E28